MTVFVQRQNRAQKFNSLGPARPEVAKSRRAHSRSAYFARQSAWGNQTLQRWLHAHAIHAKLKINQPGDKDEQEADQVAAQVMRKQNATDSRITADTSVRGKEQSVQKRDANSCHGCAGKEETIKIQANGNADRAVEGTFPESFQIDVLQGQGRPLPSSLRTLFETRFSRDFGKVRLHIDSSAAAAAKTIHAKAFTLGADVMFGAGYYAPETLAGQRLMAHELTHVVQQQALGAEDQPLQRQGVDADEDIEEEVDQDVDNSGPEVVTSGGEMPFATEATQSEVPFNWMTLPFPMGPPQIDVATGVQLSSAEIERRRKLVEASAKKAAASYPWAATLLLRWLARIPAEQKLNLGPDELLQEGSGFPLAVRNSIREVLRKGIEARLHEDHREHFQPGQKDLHLRGTGSFEFIQADQDPRTLTPLQKDLSIALGGVSYTVDALLGLGWTKGQLTTAKVTAAKISIVDYYDFNLGDQALVPLPEGMEIPASFLPADMGVVPLPPGISLEDLPIPEEVLGMKKSVNIGGQEWISVKDNWMSDIAFSGGAADFPIRIDPFDLPVELFSPFTIADKTVQ